MDLIGGRKYLVFDMDALSRLHDVSGGFYLSSFSALDRYFSSEMSKNVYVTVKGSVVDLARVYDNLEYPGLDHVDAALEHGDRRYYFRCVDDLPPRNTFPVMDLLYDPHRDTYWDPFSVYHDLRREELECPVGDEPLVVGDAAVLVSRYSYAVPAKLPAMRTGTRIPVEIQRRVFIDLLTGVAPDKGLTVLKETGFLAEYWPLLAEMDGTEHSKEGHPEGNVWKHTLETLQHRKTRDLLLATVLLLHDCGKPFATATRENLFDKHAEIGAERAGKFLFRLGFTDEFVRDARWLIRHHMIPGALHRLPTYRTAPLMASVLFPFLLEFYRCDLLSTYRGPENYYRACKIYRRFVKNSANPYRDAEGKKIFRLYVE